MSKNNSQPTSSQTCKVCAYAMQTESSETLFRCGYAYFSQPANARVQERMDLYPSVNPGHSCGHWCDRLQTLLDNTA